MEKDDIEYLYLTTYLCPSCGKISRKMDDQKVKCDYCGNTKNLIRKCREKATPKVSERELIRLAKLYLIFLKKDFIEKGHKDGLTQDQTLEVMKRVDKMIKNKKFIPLQKIEKRVAAGEIISKENKAKIFIWKRLTPEEQKRISPEDILDIIEIETEYINKKGNIFEEKIDYIEEEAAKDEKEYSREDIIKIVNIKNYYLEKNQTN